MHCHAMPLTLSNDAVTTGGLSSSKDVDTIHLSLICSIWHAACHILTCVTGRIGLYGGVRSVPCAAKMAHTSKDADAAERDHDRSGSVAAGCIWCCVQLSQVGCMLTMCTICVVSANSSTMRSGEGYDAE